MAKINFSIIILFFSHLFSAVGQTFDQFGTYIYDSPGQYAKFEGLYLKYDIREDSTFTYQWSNGCTAATIEGKWTIHLDTMTLTGSRRDLDKDRVNSLKGIIDTKILICSDGLYTLHKKSKRKYLKDKKLNKGT